MKARNLHESSSVLDIPKKKKQGNQYSSRSGVFEILEFHAFPNAPQEREPLDAVAHTPDEAGNILCWRRCRRCSNKDCRDPLTERPHQFSAAEHGMWNCPVCGKDRHCRRLIPHNAPGCRNHGGATPNGFDLPQTKTGEHSRHLRVASLKADYERFLQSQTLYGFDDRVALLKARLNEVVAEYSGGASRELLNQMKQNRKVFKSEMGKVASDPLRLRELDQELDDLLAEGARTYQVMDDYRAVSRDITTLTSARDQHMEREQLTISNDKAWMMLAHVEETFRVGVEMLVSEVDEEFVRRQCEILGVSFDTLSPQRVWELKDTYRDERLKAKKRMLTYASQRFGELAGSGPPRK